MGDECLPLLNQTGPAPGHQPQKPITMMPSIASPRAIFPPLLPAFGPVLLLTPRMLTPPMA